eukprot:gene9634-10622_t
MLQGARARALLVRFLCRRYLGEYDPTIEDSYSKKVTVDGKTSIIEVLDTANKGLGTPRREDFMSTSQAFVMVFSTTNRKTFDSIPKYKETMESYPGQRCAPVALIGTKSDLTHLRQVTRCDAQAIANANSWSYSECSAAYDLNIQSIFHNIIRRIRGDAEKAVVQQEFTVAAKTTTTTTTAIAASESDDTIFENEATSDSNDVIRVNFVRVTEGAQKVVQFYHLHLMHVMDIVHFSKFADNLSFDYLKL